MARLQSGENVRDSLVLHNPYTMLCAGTTGAGKTSFIQTLLRNAPALYSETPGKVFFFYKQYQDVFDDIDAEFIQGLPTADWIRKVLDGGGDGAANSTLVIDDQGGELTESVANLYTVYSHHSNFNIITVVHSLFGKSAVHRLISLNSRYIVIFKNPRDMSTVGHLAKQLDPGFPSRLVQIYKEATKNPYSYLFIDNSQTTNERFRLRSNVLFENGQPMAVYERQ